MEWGAPGPLLRGEQGSEVVVAPTFDASHEAAATASDLEVEDSVLEDATEGASATRCRCHRPFMHHSDGLSLFIGQTVR